MDFFYVHDRAPGTTRNFFANNVAFRRETFGARRFPEVERLRHGQCTLLAARLAREGVAIHFAPDAHSVHRFPEGLSSLVRQRLHRGCDTANLAPTIAREALGLRVDDRGARATLVSLVMLGRRFELARRELREVSPAGRHVLALASAAALTGLDAIGILTNRFAATRSASRPPRRINGQIVATDLRTRDSFRWWLTGRS